MSNRKKQFEDTLVAIGVGTLLTGATYGIYSYLKSRQATYSHPECASTPNPKKTKGKSCDENLQCPICFNAMTSNISTFNCQHSFHKKCIGQWIAISKTCPVCRTPFDEG